MLVSYRPLGNYWHGRRAGPPVRVAAALVRGCDHGKTKSYTWSYGRRGGTRTDAGGTTNKGRNWGCRKIRCSDGATAAERRLEGWRRLEESPVAVELFGDRRLRRGLCSPRRAAEASAGADVHRTPRAAHET